MEWTLNYRRANRCGTRRPSIDFEASILLDTNVVSELMREEPNKSVANWFLTHPKRNLYFSAIGEAELRLGAAIIPPGRRRSRLFADIENTLPITFKRRILPFDSKAAQAFADIGSLCRNAGRPISTSDCQIAAIAKSRGLRLATRNVRDFEGTGITLVDPWLESR
ncbi:MAG: type II toxin-antitoxin system VapC family toxin [Gammaproteobacteria bacterium]|nr:type II toxin-antitoxin system VapC family toxin [Gammaproteobacteria bacterium]MYA37213.1 type II toxin-antitoxin system VapC family toxin [Gammaproteobacteria bacterium]MYE98650.1 type II toxin-antitoxin system VapC family toxin [Gammaproteobacteria bacterium]MYH84305.1 type II toxin-antitoxin system VapC family toxin [Gammaproteobacteria bacterium]MYK03476.1 type II toxin-antitoxin system VapC family toxin [Gammaproteobacteria bacterium]